MRVVNNYLLGMDCGTTNIKAILIGENGQVVAEACKPSMFQRPGPNMHEQDANEWWSNVVEILKKLTSQAGREVVERIRGISISSHTVSMLPIDKEGKPLRNALTYQDSRSSDELQYILEQIGTEKYIGIVGGQPAVSFLPSKILWFKKHEPQLFAKTAYFLQANSYINYKLTGVITQDIDQATRTQCLDINSMEWSKTIGDVIGVDLDQVMPKIYLVDELIGTVNKEAAEITGLLAGTPVVAGCSDAMAAMHATGMCRLGEVGESSGTSSLIFIGSDRKSASNIPVVTRPCAIESMPWIFDAPMSSTGAAIKWYIDLMAAEEKKYADENGIGIYDYLNELALKSKPGSNGLMFYPYLIGERAPIWNDYARGMFIGMSMGTTRADMIRAVFEGTSFALRHVVETVKMAGAKADCLRICGGGAKSRTWGKIKASMLRMPVYILNGNSGDVPLGDALIAGRKVGVFPNMTEAVEKIVKVDEIIEPNEAWADAYDKLYPLYLGMYQSLDHHLKDLKDTIRTTC